MHTARTGVKEPVRVPADAKTAGKGKPCRFAVQAEHARSMLKDIKDRTAESENESET